MLESIQRMILVVALGLLGLGPASAEAAEVTYLVGGDREAGKVAAERTGGTWVSSLSKGFAKAAADLNAGGEVSVVLKLAAGDYDGDLGSGAYALPLFTNPAGKLRIEGGYSQDFASRAPFRNPSRVVTIAERSAPLWSFAKNSKLGSFAVDGLLFDSVASNAYDAKTNSLLIGKSSTHAFIKFNYLETDELAFDNCVFMNSANRVMETTIRAATPQAVIRFSNSIFLNNRIPLKLDTARFRNRPARIEVDHCSFLVNWAYNPDPDTGLPAAVELGPKDAADEIVLTNNLFYANFGGAILALHGQLPSLVINRNNFVGNGLLHGETEPDSVAMIVSAGGRKQPISMEQIEDVPAVDEAEGNVSVAPGIPLALGEIKTVDADQVRAHPGWRNEVARLLGKNLQGSTLAIRDYAPKKEYDPENPPVPMVPEARSYGAAP